MAPVTAPPDLAPGSGHHIMGRQASVFGRVPLAGQLRVSGRKVVYAGQQRPVGTDGTACAAYGAGLHDGLPLMAFLAYPPCHVVTAQRYVRRGHAVVFRGVPLCGQIGPLGGQVVLSRPGPFSRAVGTAAPRCAGVDRRLPFVALFAFPPHAPLAAVGDPLRRQRSVFRRVPLPKQLGSVMRPAVVI